MPSKLELIYRRVLRDLARIARPWISKRHGYFYLFRRTLLDWFAAAIAPRSERFAVEAIPIATIQTCRPDVTISELEPPERFSLPGLRGSRDARILHLDDPYEAPPQKLVRIPRGIVTHYGHVGLHPGAIISDFATPVKTPIREQRSQAAVSLDLGLIDVTGVVVSVLQHAHTNYSHWLLQGLPRLGLVLRVQPAETIDVILVPARPRPFLRECLERCGIRSESVLSVPASGTPMYRCETLVAATIADIDLVGSPWAVEFITSLFPQVDRNQTRRIYVSRGEAISRAVVNEPAVIRALQSFDFEVLSMDGRSVAEQAEIFAGAGTIVAPHGAALANLAFVKPGAAVIELMPANTLSPMYSRLARQIGLHYEVLVGTEPTLPKRFQHWLRDADMVVDVAALQRRVEAVLTADASSE